VLLCALLSSCTPKLASEQEENQQEEQPNVIELVAQEWPGQAPKPYQMPVHPGLDKLEFGDPSELGLQSNDLILGVTMNEGKVAIPLTYLEGFEVANFSLSDQFYLITWCGLVGTAHIYRGDVMGDTSGFDFGRALHHNNLLMVDRKTKSVWNQLSSEAIHGELEGTNLEMIPSLQTTWDFWKRKYPDTKVLMNRDTTGAVWPSLLFTKPYYTSWHPDSGKYYMENKHQTNNLGLGLKVADSTIFFPLEQLFNKTSPIAYAISNQRLAIHFDPSGLTAWAEDVEGSIVPSTLSYDWACKSFHPESLVYTE